MSMTGLEQRYCSLTFEKEDLSSGGASFVDCAGCRITWYRDRDARRQHLSIHNDSCRHANPNTLETIRGYAIEDLPKLMRQLCEVFDVNSRNKAENYHLLYPLLLRLQQLCSDKNAYNELPPKIQKETTLYMKHAIFSLKKRSQSESISIHVKQMWGSPGFTSFILGLDMISEPMRRRKELGQPPTADELVDDEDSDFRLPKLFSLITDSFLFHACACYEDEEIKRTHHSIGLAAMKKILESWKDPFSRASLPISIGRQLNRGAVILNAITHGLMHSSAHMASLEDDFVPGLSLEELLPLLFVDRTLLLPKNERYLQLFMQRLLLSQPCEEKENGSSCRFQWESLSEEVYVAVIENFFDWFDFISKSTSFRLEESEQQMTITNGTRLLFAILGRKTGKFLNFCDQAGVSTTTPMSKRAARFLHGRRTVLRSQIRPLFDQLLIDTADESMNNYNDDNERPKLLEDSINLILEFAMPRSLSPRGKWQAFDRITGELFFQYDDIYEAAQCQGISTHGIEANLNQFRSDRGGGYIWRTCLETSGRKLYAADPETNEVVYEFNGFIDATKKYGISHDDIAQNMNTYRNIRGKTCIWWFCNKDTELKYVAFDPSTKQPVHEYNSLSAAASDLNISPMEISQNISPMDIFPTRKRYIHARRRVGGFYWRKYCNRSRPSE